MRSKAPLLLMEQMVMLLVFALAAALCLQTFSVSDRISARSEAQDRAVVLVQTAAETIRHCGGTPEHALRQAAESLGGTYDQGVLRQDCGIGILTARGVPAGTDGLYAAFVAVEDDGAVLFEISVAWQGGLGNGA